MASRVRAKPGAIFIEGEKPSPGELIAELTHALERLDPKAGQRLHGEHGPVLVYMAEAAARGEDDWYATASRDWQKRADALSDDVVAGLKKIAPKGHRFGPLMGDGRLVEWGFWEVKKNPDEDEENVRSEAFFFSGMRENPKLELIRPGDHHRVFRYRGREIHIRQDHGKPAAVQIIRHGVEKGSDVGVLLEEYKTRQPFPHLEAKALIDGWHEEAKRGKRKHRPKRSNKALKRRDASTVAERLQQRMRNPPRLREPGDAEVPLVARKNGGALFRFKRHHIEVQPIGGVMRAGDERHYAKNVNVVVVAPDDTALDVFHAWNAGDALAKGVEVVNTAISARPNPKEEKLRAKKDGSARSFMRRMLNV
jgi:hypothetical protein